MSRVLLWSTTTTNVQYATWSSITLRDSFSNYDYLDFVSIDGVVTKMDVSAFVATGVLVYSCNFSASSWATGVCKAPYVFDSTHKVFTPQFTTFTFKAIYDNNAGGGTPATATIMYRSYGGTNDTSGSGIVLSGRFYQIWGGMY